MLVIGLNGPILTAMRNGGTRLLRDMTLATCSVLWEQMPPFRTVGALACVCASAIMRGGLPDLSGAHSGEYPRLSPSRSQVVSSACLCRCIGSELSRATLPD